MKKKKTKEEEHQKSQAAAAKAIEDDGETRRVKRKAFSKLIWEVLRPDGAGAGRQCLDQGGVECRVSRRDRGASMRR